MSKFLGKQVFFPLKGDRVILFQYPYFNENTTEAGLMRIICNTDNELAQQHFDFLFDKDDFLKIKSGVDEILKPESEE